MVDVTYLLDGVAVTGASLPKHLHQGNVNHTVACHYIDANGSISALTLVLEGSIDPPGVADADLNWFSLATHEFTAAEIAAKSAMFHVVNRAVFRIRLNLTVLTGEAAGDLVYATYNTGR